MSTYADELKKRARKLREENADTAAPAAAYNIPAAAGSSYASELKERAQKLRQSTGQRTTAGDRDAYDASVRRSYGARSGSVADSVDRERQTYKRAARDSADALRALQGAASTRAYYIPQTPQEQQTMDELLALAKERSKAAQESKLRLDDLRNNEWMRRKEEQFSGIESREGFEAKSAFVDQGAEDPAYRYINSIDGFDALVRQAALGGHSGMEKYDRMTDDERGIYNYLYNSGDTQGASEYLEYLSYALNERAAQENAALWQEQTRRAPAAASAASVGINMASGLGMVDAAAQLAARRGNDYAPVDRNRLLSGPSRTVSAIRETVGGDLRDEGKNALAFGYDTGMSMADSLAAMLLGAGAGGAVKSSAAKQISLALQGSAAGTQAMRAAKERGATDGEAFAVGAVAGAAEAAFEKISIESLLQIGDVRNAGAMLLNILKQSGVEGSEEGLTYIANTIAESILLGDSSSYRAAVSRYVDDGYSESEARQLAAKDWAKELGLNILGGAISGGVMGAGMSGAQTLLGTARDAQYGKAYNTMPGLSRIEAQEALLESARESGEGTKSRLFAERMAQRGRPMTNAQTGRLARLTQEDIEREESAVAAELVNAGATEAEAETLTPVIAAVLQGEEISGNQAAEIAKNEAAVSVLERATGAIINTNAPLGQVKTTIRGLASRQSAQVEPAAAEDTTAQAQPVQARETASDAPTMEAVTRNNVQAVADFAKTMEKAGAAAMTQMYDGSQSAEQYVAGMMRAYNAGRNGADMASINTEGITGPQARAAYIAGQADAADVTAVAESGEKRYTQSDPGVSEPVGQFARSDAAARGEAGAVRPAAGEVKEDVNGQKETVSDPGHAESTGGISQADTGAKGSRRSRYESRIKEILRKHAASSSGRNRERSARVERKEARNDFEDRMRADGYFYAETKNGGAAMGFKFAAEENWSSEAKTAHDTLKKWGFEVIVFDGEMHTNRKGISEVSTEGQTLRDGRDITIFLSSSLDIDGMETAYHEALHAIRTGPNVLHRVKIENIILDNVNMDSAEFESFVTRIADLYSYAVQDVSEERFAAEIMEEFYAWYVGKLHASDAGVWGREINAFSDAETVKAEIDAIYAKMEVATESASQSEAAATEEPPAPATTEGQTGEAEGYTEGSESAKGGTVYEEETGTGHAGEQERTPGVASGRQGGSLEAGTGSPEAGRSGGDQAERAAGLRARAAAAGVVSQSAQEQGISIGTRRKTLKVLPSGLWDDDIRSVVREKAKKGIHVVPIVGPIEAKDAGGVFTANGWMSPDGKRMLVRVDHDTLTMRQIADHEEYHAKAGRDAKLDQQLKKQLAKKYGKGWERFLANAYAEMYYSGQELTRELEDYILQEILADAYAGIDVLRNVENVPMRATDLTAQVREAADKVKARGPPVDGDTNVPGNGRFSIETLEDGRKFVKADRQVIFGSDPDSWSEQLEDYINGKIRRGEDVVIIGADGDELVLTATSAGKLSDNHTSDGRTMSEDSYERKVNAASHIDELAQVSVRGKKNTPDINMRHGDMAKDGWNYRTAYFLDFDGKYYRVTISVSLGENGKMIYNIGQMKEEAHPKIKGSRATSDDGPRGFASSDSRVPQSETDVKEKFSRDSEGRELTQEQVDRLTSYTALVSRPDMTVTEIDDTAQYTANSQTRKTLVQQAIKNAAAIGKTNSNGGVSVHVDDIGRDVLLSTHSLRHGLDRRFSVLAPITEKAGEILQNSVLINKLTPQNQNVSDSYVLLGAAKNAAGEPYIVRFVVNQHTNEVATVDVLYAINAKKESAALLPAITGNPATLTDSTISIARLLDFARDYFPDVLPESVLRHYGFAERPNGKLGESALFSREADLSDPELQERLTKLLEEYGAIRPGENPFRNVNIPRRTEKENRVSQTVRTILEAEATPDELVPTVERMVADGELSYTPYSDEQAVSDARAKIERNGWEAASREWFDDMKRGAISKSNTTIGWLLYDNAANSGNTAEAIDILNQMVESQRSAAQALQATRILKQLSPETQLYGVQRSVNSLQDELVKRYGNQVPDLHISEELAEKFLKARSDHARAEALKDIYRDIGRQMPSRFMDKFNAWRYIAMLSNPRTHVRNIIGNTGFVPVIAAKNLTATAIESIVLRNRGGRTKAFGLTTKRGRELLRAAWNDYANIKQDMPDGKYSDLKNANRYIEEGRQIFGRTQDAKTKAGKILAGTLGKGVEKVRLANSKALSAEDQWFARPHYAAAMAQYCLANGITKQELAAGEGKKIADAREYAMKEAKKATYQDVNEFSAWFSRLGRSAQSRGVGKIVNQLSEGVLPFRKTPANILVRAVEYSPLGLVWNVKKVLIDVQKGNATAAEAIDGLAAGLTGTALVGLGILLSALGVVRGHGDDDEAEKEFNQLQGHQYYALELPNGTSITLDWLAPEALPFFVGVNLYESTNGMEEAPKMADLLGAMTNATEPLLEMSCLQGLNDIIESVGYASSNGLAGVPQMTVSSATSLLTQLVPTFFGQLERSGEPVRMTTYTDKNKWLDTDTQYFIGKVSAKIPGLDYQQVPYIDAWGRTEYNGGPFERVFNNMLNPAYLSEVNTSETEQELQRLYDETGESGVFPSRAGKYFTVNGERIDLTADQYVEFATYKGNRSYELVADAIETPWYHDMDDSLKVSVIESCYSVAQEEAKALVSDYRLGGIHDSIAEAEKNGISAAEYLIFYKVTNAMRNIKDSDGGIVENKAGQVRAWLKNSGFTNEQKAFLWSTLYKEPY